MLKELFSRKSKITEETIIAPISGKLLSLEKVPDPVFSQKLMGDGVAIEPTEGAVVSPVNGEVVQIFHTKHAIGIRSETGLELLIHIGLETVALNGKGFESHVKEGAKVKPGDLLITFDLEWIKENAASIITPIVITNSEIVENVHKEDSEHTIKGQTNMMSVKVKG